MSDTTDTNDRVEPIAEYVQNRQTQAELSRWER